MPETQGIFGFSSVNWGATPNHEVQPKKKTQEQALAANSVFASAMQAGAGIR